MSGAWGRWCVIAVCTWCLSGCASSGGQATAVPVRRGSIQAMVDALGQVEPAISRALVPRLSGQVQSVAVREGDAVVVDQELMHLDDRVLRLELDQAERLVVLRQELLDAALRAPDASTVALARARMRRATAIRQNAQEDYDAIADQPDAESSDEAVDLESAKLEYEIAQAEFDRVFSAAADAEVLRLELDLRAAEQAATAARERLETATLRAPIDGTVTEWGLQVGDWVFAGNGVGQVADLAALQVRAEISELDVAQLSEGLAVRVQLDAFPGQVISGTLAYLPPTLDTSRGVPTANALIALGEHGLPLRVGMGANLRVVLTASEEVLLIPRRAVHEVGTQHVVRVRTGRRVEERAIEVGVSNGAEIEIVSGLAEGEAVLLD